MPKDTLAICLGKSTYARCGIIVNVTPFEPGFEGYITNRNINTIHYPGKNFIGKWREIAQVLFFPGRIEPVLEFTLFQD